MMNKKKLERIQQSIRQNWGKTKPFKKVPRRHFNCYMFAVCCTQPEILSIFGATIVLFENTVYFGNIGRFSGSKYSNIEEYKTAVLKDLVVLGIEAEVMEKDFKPDEEKGEIKIAFFSNYETEYQKQNGHQFHFLRFVPAENRWMGKAGYPGGFQLLPKYSSIDEISVIDQQLLLLLKLKLK